MPAKPAKLNRRRGATLFVVAWALCCVTGFGVLARYGNTPGEAGAAVGDVSSLAALKLDTTRPTVVMYVHPHCPCTSASLESLARLQRRFEGRFATRVVFCVPPGMDPDWHRASLWEQVGRLPDCERVIDAGGRVSREAGAATSGTVGVYDTNGRLQFWGGITPSRAHAGDSAGSDAIAEYLNGLGHAQRSAVFGCPLSGCGDAQCDAFEEPIR